MNDRAPLPDAEQPSAIALASDEVHVWHAPLERLLHALPRLSALLSPDEQQRCGRYLRECDRAQFALSRGILRQLLARYCGIPGEAIVFHYSTRGRPTLPASAASGQLQFSVSHTRGMAVYALTRERRIGIDVEQVRPVQAQDLVVSQHFAEEEVAAYSRLSGDARQRGFFNGWTRKEAFVKALGEGLSHPLSAFAVTLTPGEPARLLRIDSGFPEQWLLCDLTQEPSHIIALAAEGTSLRISSRTWSACSQPFEPEGTSGS
jgi:4'-phosphopantetheinyl transferase